ncbi:MAG: hypothetical protein Q9N68_07130 [Gammaproteobacteria bacterium]|nr:hypothetical protein [Gammaproteobacteria bacterium]
MQAIEIETEIDESREIHIKLPPQVQARQARVVVMYDEPVEVKEAKADGKIGRRQFGQFLGQVQMSEDFDAPLSEAFWLGEQE